MASECVNKHKGNSLIIAFHRFRQSLYFFFFSFILLELILIVIFSQISICSSFISLYKLM